MSGNSQSVYTGGAISPTGTSSVNMNHSHTERGNNSGTTYNAVDWSGSGTSGIALNNERRTGSVIDTGSKDLSHRHEMTFTPSVSGSISSTDTETRPLNYTVRIWKRVS